MALEGVRVLEEAENAGCEIDAVVITENFGNENRERKLLERWRARRIRVFLIGEKTFSSISAVRTPQGAMALAHTPVYVLDEIQYKERSLILCASGIQDPGNLGTLIRLDEIQYKERSLILCASGIQDPGNLGTLIRMGAAAGADMILTTTGTVSALNPKTLRASAGAFFHVPVIEHLKTGELLSYCDRNNIRMYRTSARDGVSYAKADLACSCAVFLGNEGAGVNDAALARLPVIHIPMSENTESLNVASAGAIIMFEAVRQRSEQIQRQDALEAKP